jgi:hypothetical protein
MRSAAAAGEHIIRWLPLRGADNVREIGGMPGTGGRIVRTGLVLRGDAPRALTDEDVVLLVHRYGLRTVFDLRSHAEAVLDGHGLLPAAGVRVQVVPMLTRDPEAVPGEVPEARLPAGVPAARTPAGAAGVVTGEMEIPRRFDYGLMAAGGAAAIINVLTALTRPETGTALVHCAAGKDRTGVLIAILLEVLGVDRATIMADYLATGERIEAIAARRRDVPSARTAPRTTQVDRRFLVTLFDELDSRGGASAWLIGHGAPARLARALRARLLISCRAPA